MLGIQARQLSIPKSATAHRFGKMDRDMLVSDQQVKAAANEQAVLGDSKSQLFRLAHVAKRHTTCNTLTKSVSI